MGEKLEEMLGHGKATIKHVIGTCIISAALLFPNACLKDYNKDKTIQAEIIKSQNRSIVFISDLNGAYDVYRIKKDGKDLEQLTISEGVSTAIYGPEKRNEDMSWTHCSNASISPDGKFLLYERSIVQYVDDNKPRRVNAIYLMDVNTKIERPLRFNTGTEPVWSPDGKQVCFVSDAGQICVVNLRGIKKRAVASSDKKDSNPYWGKSGVLFSRELSAERSDIYLIKGDSENPINLTEKHDGIYVEPAFSPDCEQIACIKKKSAEDLGGIICILYKDKDGMSIRELLMPNLKYCNNPVWIDDKNLIFSANEDKLSNLYSVGAYGRDLERLTYKGNSSMPSF